MNERIRKLAREAGLDDPDFPIEDWDNVPLANFAELIIKDQQREWVGLTDEEIHMTTVLLGFNPEWKTEIGMTRAIVRNLEAKLKEKNT